MKPAQDRKEAEAEAPRRLTRAQGLYFPSRPLGGAAGGWRVRKEDITSGDGMGKSGEVEILQSFPLT